MRLDVLIHRGYIRTWALHVVGYGLHMIAHVYAFGLLGVLKVSSFAHYCTFQTVSSGRLIVTRDLPIGSPVIGSPTYVMRDSEPVGPAIVHLRGYLRVFPAR